MGRSSERNQEASSPRSLSQEGKGEPYPYIAESLRPLAVPIDTLMPDAANARRHSERNLEAIKASLTRFGQRAPIVVQRDGMIVRAGNGRLEAAKSLGWTHIAAVIVDDSSVDAVAFAIADNRTAELAEWDTETLATLLDSLPQEVRIDTGFTEADLSSLMRSLDIAEPIDTPKEFKDASPTPSGNVCPKCGFDLGAGGIDEDGVDC